MIAVAVLAATLLAAQSTPPAPTAPPTLAVVTTFADGHTHYELLSSRPSGYGTGDFPRIYGADSPTLLKLMGRLDGDAARVTVSVLYFARPESEREVEVASVLVSRDKPVTVDDALRRHGVQPIRLSLMTVTPRAPFPPSAFSDIPELEISGVEVLTAPYPGFRVTVRNVSNKAASSFFVKSSLGTATGFTEMKSPTAGRPVLPPMDSYTFDRYLTGGDANGPQTMDVINIASVRWADGSSAGPMTAADAANAVPADAGRRALLQQANAVLKAALAAPALSVETIVSQLQAIPDRDASLPPDAQRSRTQAKRMVLDDVRRFQQRGPASDAAALRASVQTLIDRYQGFISRLSSL